MGHNPMQPVVSMHFYGMANVTCQYDVTPQYANCKAFDSARGTLIAEDTSYCRCRGGGAGGGGGSIACDQTTPNWWVYCDPFAI